MKTNKIYPEIEILSAGARGVGIAKNETGKTVMIQGGVPGDILKIEIYRKKNSFEIGKILDILKPSPYRISPKCSYFGVCGGCSWQNIDYQQQTDFKQLEVTNNIQRIGGIRDFNVEPIIISDDEYEYRNKMEFSFSNARWLTEEEIKSGKEIENKNALGFHIPKQWSKVLDIEKCYLQPDLSNKIRNYIKDLALKENISFYNIKESSGILRSLMVRNNSINEWMIVFQFYEDFDVKNEFLSQIQNQFPEIKTILYAINPKANDSIYDLNIEVFSGDGFIMEEFLIDNRIFKFKISPKSFFQTNYKQAHKLYQATIDFAELKGNETVYDLYSGTGTIAQLISRKAEKVVGIESVQEATTAAQENATFNGITNCEFICGDMKDIFNVDFMTHYGKPDIIITDPPRDGMHPRVIQNILDLSPEKIVYVSCNSATQARDLALLKEKYTLIKSQAVDMFPQTFHIENIVLLKKK